MLPLSGVKEKRLVGVLAVKQIHGPKVVIFQGHSSIFIFIVVRSHEYFNLHGHACRPWGTDVFPPGQVAHSKLALRGIATGFVALGTQRCLDRGSDTTEGGAS